MEKEYDYWFYCLFCKALFTGPMANRSANWTEQVTEEGLFACPLCHKARYDMTTEGTCSPVSVEDFMPYNEKKEEFEKPSFVKAMRILRNGEFAYYEKDWFQPNYDCFVDGHACGEPGWKIVADKDETGWNGYKVVKE